MAKEVLMIVDGNAVLHRAWHALPPLTTAKGELVNAVYGFVTIVLKAIKDLSPTHCVVTFDRRAPTFRHEAFAPYKAQRKKQPDELYQQLDRIKEILDALHVARCEKDGFEADDIIATLCAKARQDVSTVIVTGDMDTLQLVDGHTRVYAFKRGLTDTTIYDEKAVLERYDGLNATQLTEFKALRGDPSDNIPGAKGVGEKTAIDLVKEYGTVDALYTALHAGTTGDGMKKGLVEKLLTQEEQVRLSRKLVELIRDVDIDCAYESTRLGGYDTKKTTDLFIELEFKTLIPRLAGLPGFEQHHSAVHDESKFSYQCLDTEKKILDFLDVLEEEPLCSVDTETTSTDAIRADLVGVSFSIRKGEGVYLPWTVKGSKWKKRLAEVLENEKVKKVGHNIKYDIEVFHRAGVRPEGFVCDTMLAAYLLNAGSREYGLDALSLSEFGHQKIPITSLIGKGPVQSSMADVPLEKIAPYACEDADFTLRLYHVLKARLIEARMEKLHDTIELPLVNALIEMEEAGVLLDQGYLLELSKRVSGRLSEMTEAIHRYAGEEFNINSPAQLKKILFDKLKLSSARIKKGKSGFSTAASELEKMKDLHPIIGCMIEYRELAKLLNTYVDVLPDLINPETGRIHTNFNQTIAATGRLSSSNPNLQNIPIRQELGREIRHAFIAADGYRLLSADYSQMQLRIVAHLAGDEKMLKAFRDGVDIHAATAAEVNGIPLSDVTPQQRRAAKEVNFGILYGMGPQGLAVSAGISFSAAQAFIESYFLAYPKIRSFLDVIIAIARKTGYVETAFGRRRYVPELQSGVAQVRNAAERAAVNMPIQGTEADIMKLAMIAVHGQLPEKWRAPRPDGTASLRMVLQVHDELLFEVREDLVKEVSTTIQSMMEGVVSFSVPMSVDMKSGKNWGAMLPV